MPFLPPSHEPTQNISQLRAASPRLPLTAPYWTKVR